MSWESAQYHSFWFGPAVKVKMGHPAEMVRSSDTHAV